MRRFNSARGVLSITSEVARGTRCASKLQPVRVRRLVPWLGLQGLDNPVAHSPRSFSDRVVDYDVYNDLGHLPSTSQQDPIDPRPILGGGKDVRSVSVAR